MPSDLCRVEAEGELVMTEPIQNPVENPIQSIVRWADDRVGRKGAVTIAAVAIVRGSQRDEQSQFVVVECRIIDVR